MAYSTLGRKLGRSPQFARFRLTQWPQEANLQTPAPIGEELDEARSPLRSACRGDRLRRSGSDRYRRCRHGFLPGQHAHCGLVGEPGPITRARAADCQRGQGGRQAHQEGGGSAGPAGTRGGYEQQALSTAQRNGSPTEPSAGDPSRDRDRHRTGGRQALSADSRGGWPGTRRRSVGPQGGWLRGQGDSRGLEPSSGHSDRAESRRRFRCPSGTSRDAHLGETRACSAANELHGGLFALSPTGV